MPSPSVQILGGRVPHPPEIYAHAYIGNFTGILLHARYSSSVRQPNCGVQQRAPLILGRVAITFGNGIHSSFVFHLPEMVNKVAYI